MNNQELISAFEERLITQRYSPNSIKIYVGCVCSFLKTFSKYNPQDISLELIEKYILWIIKEKNISASYQKQILFSITKFYDSIYNKKLDLYSLYPKRAEYKLPKYLSLSDVQKIINETDNLKHKSIISVLYGGGLRLSELINLQLSDINSDKMLIFIRQSKGKKDRVVMLSEKLLTLLRQYYVAYKPKVWLFEGQSGGQYSAKSIQQVVKSAAQKAGININVTPHTLRHAFATHLIENGTDIRFIQELLGHNSIKTTEKYTLITDVSKSKIKSPLDLL
ncbi:site-specific tyrosine recombinase/integron integrase [Bergeyella zoohelcum]|uniref:site-specific tyrosine recombinase/integron integrase n=1 Tax=Bergeyella zoohelcum TaxID=1015 RepID=UPI0037361E8A